MATYNDIPYTDFSNVCVKDTDGGVLRFKNARSAALTASDDFGVYVRGTNLYFWNGTSETNLLSGDGGGATSWDDLYADDTTLSITGDTLTFAGAAGVGANDVFTLTAAGAVSGDVLQITNSGTGNDISGTSATWSVTKAGVATFTGVVLADDESITFGDSSDATIDWDGTGGALDIGGVVNFENNVTMAASATVTQTGVAGSTVYTITAGDVVYSDSSLSITDADNAETVTVINNTATTIGNASSTAVFQIESTSLTTGALLNLQLTEGTLNGGSYFRAWDATGGSAVFTVAEDGVTTIAGVAAGSNSVVVTSGDIFLSDTDASKLESEDGTGTLLTLDNKAGVIASDTAVLLLDAGGAVASGGNLLRVAPTGSPNAGAIGIEYVGAAKAMTAMYIDGDPTASSVVAINGGGALTDGNAVLALTNDGNLAVGGALLSVVMGGTPNAGAIAAEITAEKDAIALYISSSAATNDAVTITGGGAIADNKALLDIVGTGTPAAAGSNLLRVDGTGLTATNKPVLAEIAGAGKDVSGLYVDVDNTTTHGVYIDGSGALNAGRALLVDNDGTPAANTDAVAEITFTGTATNNPVVLNVNNSTKDAAPLLVTSNVAAATRSVGTFIQDSTTGAKEVITLQQDDVSEEFIAFNSTAGAGQAVDLTSTTPAAVAGSVLVTAVDGTAYRLALYAAAGWS